MELNKEPSNSDGSLDKIPYPYLFSISLATHINIYKIKSINRKCSVIFSCFSIQNMGHLLKKNIINDYTKYRRSHTVDTNRMRSSVSVLNNNLIEY